MLLLKWIEFLQQWYRYTHLSIPTPRMCKKTTAMTSWINASIDKAFALFLSYFYISTSECHILNKRINQKNQKQGDNAINFNDCSDEEQLKCICGSSQAKISIGIKWRDSPLKDSKDGLKQHHMMILFENFIKTNFDKFENCNLEFKEVLHTTMTQRGDVTF